MILSFCESVHAGPLSVWHLRWLDESGPKPGGGITTGSLCGTVSARFGWDLEVPITERHLANNTCYQCVKALRPEAS